MAYEMPAPGTEVRLESDTLALVRFGAEIGEPRDAREFRVPLHPLGDLEIVERWRSREPVERGWLGDLGYARNSGVMLVQLAVAESRFEGLEKAAFAAYERLQAFVAAAGYPYAIRIWNYVADINAGNGDEERYRQFNAGRARILESLPGFQTRLPAASAIGGAEPGLVLHLLAARYDSVQIENPRQVSAFRYPPRYGVRSPCFSRARWARWPRERHLYLSGTASVVGHETLHEGDCLAQLHETLRNIASVLDRSTFEWSDLRALRVYLRDLNDLVDVRSALEGQLGAAAPILCLRADICRRDLAIEIEGLFVSETP